MTTIVNNVASTDTQVRFESLVEGLHLVESKRGWWNGRCPAHNDRKPSFGAILNEEGFINFKCLAGCTADEILIALGWDKRDTYPNRKPEYIGEDRIIAYYNYHDKDGKVIYRKVRTINKDFRLQRKIGNDWIDGLDVVEPVLYRLHEVLKEGYSEFWPIFFVEGEKDVETLRKGDLCATCNPCGAGEEWREEYSTPFKDRHVVIIPDNDDKGKIHAEKVASHLVGIAASIRVIVLDGAKDVTEWCEETESEPDEVHTLLHTAKTYTPGGIYTKPAKEAKEDPSKGTPRVTGIVEYQEPKRLIDWIDKEYPPIKWVIPRLIPAGLTVFGARFKSGKSWQMQQIGLERGSKVFGQVPSDPGDTFYLALEDSDARVSSRAKKQLNGKEVPDNFYYELHWPKLKNGGLDWCRSWLDTHTNNPLIIADTMHILLEKSRTGIPNYDDDLEQFWKVKEMLREYPDAGFIAVMHTTKSTHEDPFLQISGSVAIQGTADSIMVMKKEPTTPRMVLNAVGRDFAEIEMFMYFNPDTCLWTIDEGVIEPGISPERKAIQRVLEEFGELTVKQVSEKIAIQTKADGTPMKTLEKHQENIKKLLQSMDRDRQTVKLGRGTYKPISNLYTKEK